MEFAGARWKSRPLPLFFSPWPSLQSLLRLCLPLSFLPLLSLATGQSWRWCFLPPWLSLPSFSSHSLSSSCCFFLSPCLAKSPFLLSSLPSLPSLPSSLPWWSSFSSSSSSSRHGTVVVVVLVAFTVVVVGPGYEPSPFGALDAYASHALAINPIAISIDATPALRVRCKRMPIRSFSGSDCGAIAPIPDCSGPRKVHVIAPRDGPALPCVVYASGFALGLSTNLEMRRVTTGAERKVSRIACHV